MRSKLFSVPLDSASTRPGQILRLAEFTLLKAGLAQDVGTRSALLGVTGSRFTLIPFALEPPHRPHVEAHKTEINVILFDAVKQRSLFLTAD